jgi:hypothetical protein
MLDDELREQLAEWVRPVTTLPVPHIRVLRRRARRRGMRRAAAAAAITAVVAAVTVGVTVSLPGTGGQPAGATPAPAGPPSWSPAPGTWHHGAWQPAGPPLAPDSSPTAAPYIVIPWDRGYGLQVRDVLAGRQVAIVKALAGQFLGGVAGAGDDRTFVVEAEMGGPAQQPGGPPTGITAVAFDELRLRPDGQPASLRLLFTIPATGISGFAVSQDASMLAYTTGSGFEAVSLAAGTGRSWSASHAGAVGQFSLSWAGDRTVAFEWKPAENPHPPGIGIRMLDVTAPGTLLTASRLIVPYRRYCAAAAKGGWGCIGDPVLTPDGSKVVVAKGTRQGSVYTDSVVEYSTRTGQALADVAPPVSSAFPGKVCVPLWTNPTGEQVVSYCGHPEEYDHGRVTPITLHQPMYGTDIVTFGWQPGSPGLSSRAPVVNGFARAGQPG